MKKISSKLPQIILIIGVLIYWVDSTSIFNPFALIGVLILILSIFIHSKIINILTAVIFAIISIVMLLAVLSEFLEFETGDAEGIKLLLIGSSIFISTLILSIIIGIKSLKTANY